MMIAQQAKQCMVSNQLRTSEITDASVLAAMEAIPREKFVPENFRKAAYVDEDIAIAEERYLMEPLVFAKLLQAMQIQPEDKVLIVGTGMGYSTAVIAQLSRHVTAIESQRELSGMARKNLRTLSIEVEVFTSALTVGYPLLAPYDAILVEGGVHFVPTSLTDQLAEAGRLVTVENIQQRAGALSGLGRALVIYKMDGQLHRRYLFDAAVPLLADFTNKPGFLF